MARILRILSVAFVTAGLVVLIDAGITLAWKEPLSAIYGNFQQSQAEDDLATLTQSFRADTDIEGMQADALADRFADKIENGDAIGRIEVPSVGIDYVFVQGTDEADLEKGPGHYPDTGLPGQGRTIGIAGHRTTYLAPFHDIAEIDVGDEVDLDMPYGKFRYEVTKTDIVDPTDVQVVDDVGVERVVMTACHPLYSAAQRYVVTAELKSFERIGR
jgi:sortase A